MNATAAMMTVTVDKHGNVQSVQDMASVDVPSSQHVLIRTFLDGLSLGVHQEINADLRWFNYHLASEGYPASDQRDSYPRPDTSPSHTGRILQRQYTINLQLTKGNDGGTVCIWEI